jgi:intraflagellar transport protein 56
MLLSRSAKKSNKLNKPSKTSNSASVNKRHELYNFEEYIQKTDFSGAKAVLENKRRNGDTRLETTLWIAYCNAHLGDYAEALKEYKKLFNKAAGNVQIPSFVGVLMGVCYFMLGMYEDAKTTVEKTRDKCDESYQKLATRILFHASHKLNLPDEILRCSAKFKDEIDDKISVAAMHFLRGNYQDALNIYKDHLKQNCGSTGYLALNVYVALCYYKMDFFDVSQEVLQVYLDENPDSAIACNLKASNYYRLFSAKHAEQELRRVSEISSPHYSYCRELINHNLCVFKNGEGAQQVLPPLVGVVPEALTNLAVYYLKNDEIEEAYNLMKDTEPQTPSEYSIKGTVYAMYGQRKGNKEFVRQAQQYFQVVGASSTECDTIPGRQAMASCFFLLKQFNDVLIYLNSIKMYFKDNDDFNYNYGQAKAAIGKWVEAEDALSRVQSELIKNEYVYLNTLMKAFIKNGKARKAFEVYMKLDAAHPNTFDLLNLLANDCYRSGQFLYAAKAFDVLERLEPTEELWNGKCGACIGIFQSVIAEQCDKDDLVECLMLLRNSDNPQAEYITQVITLWAEESGLIPSG